MNKKKSDSIKINTLKKMMLESLKKTLGVVYTAAKAVEKDLILLGQSKPNASTLNWYHYDWIKSDEEYLKEYSEIENLVMDFGESKLYQLIDKGDTAATIFFAKTKLQKRGFVETTKIDHTTKGEQIRFNIGFTSDND